MEVIPFSVTGLRLLGLGALRLTSGVGLCNALVFICIFLEVVPHLLRAPQESWVICIVSK